jgi:hypothetical protein
MGKSLGLLAAQAAGDSLELRNQGMQPLRDLSTAVNLRTADHLQLEFSQEDKKAMDLTFPATR